LVIDPFNQQDIFGRKLDRIIHEIVFSTTFCILLTLLLVLTGLFSAFNIENNYLNIDNDTEKNPSLFKEYKFQILHTVRTHINKDSFDYSCNHLPGTIHVLIS